jgi:hypothetical protein
MVEVLYFPCFPTSLARKGGIKIVPLGIYDQKTGRGEYKIVTPA